MQITVRIKSVCGVPRVYPACPKAEIFRSLGGGPTLTPFTLEKVKALGYEVVTDEGEKL